MLEDNMSQEEKKAVRIGIDIRVELKEGMSPEKRLEFAEGVMAVFRASFPEAQPIRKTGYPSPVTVRWWTAEEVDEEAKRNVS